MTPAGTFHPFRRASYDVAPVARSAAIGDAPQETAHPQSG